MCKNNVGLPNLCWLQKDQTCSMTTGHAGLEVHPPDLHLS